MEGEIINLNGVEYVRRDSIKDIENELANLKQIMKEICQLASNVNDNAPVIANKRSKVNVNDGDVFKVPLAAQELWEVTAMDDDGNFFTKNNRKLKVTIKEVFIAQKELSRHTTVKEARELRKQLNINGYTFNRLVYNLQQDTFSKFIRQWNRKTQPVVGKKQVPFENNVEKRKEKGYYI